MALKRRFSDKEKFGLTQEEITIAEKYLRKFKTAGAIPDTEAMKLYELYMLGCSFNDIVNQYPQYSIDRLILTCALRGWAHDRDRMMGSLRERVQAKVVKSVIDQVDFLTTLLSVTNVEHLEEMRKYVLDPANNELPAMRIKGLKDYKETVETLYKIVAGATPGSNAKASPLFGALSPTPARAMLKKGSEPEEEDSATLIAEAVESD
jgi:hypothetical protein